MHVIVISDYGHISGGAAQVAITSARALAEQGVRVSFACALGPIDAHLEHPGIRVHCLQASSVWNRRRPWQAAAQGIWNAAAGRWIAPLLRGHAPGQTLIHVHQWTKALSPSVLAAADASGLPVVVSLHDYFLRCPNGAYYVFPQQRPCTLQPLSLGCLVADCDSRSRAHKLVRLARQVATGAALRRRPLNVIHVSERAAAVARPLLPSATRHWVLRNPVAAAAGPRLPAERNRAVVCVGRLTEEKGCLVLARAAALVGMPLLVMGEGPALAQMQAACPDLQLRPWGDAAAVERCFAQARVLALPSLWYETGGLVVQEALARGVPAIVSTISGAAEVVGDTCGLRVPPGDVAALAAALRTLADDALVQRLSENAYRTMQSGSQHPAAHAQGLQAIYRSLLQTA